MVGLGAGYVEDQKMIKDAGSKFDDYLILPKIRQVLLHWGYAFTEKDFLMSWQINVWKWRFKKIK